MNSISPSQSSAQLGHVLCVVGARPNFMKIAPIMTALKQQGLRATLVHTGQHYDAAMNQQYFDALAIAAPDYNLDVGSGSHAVQTAQVMQRFEPVLDTERPDAVLVVGDVNSTLACALVANKKGIRVIHVEAGLRSFDRTMPEEINRLLTDQLSHLLFATEASAVQNLQREGIDAANVHFVGNVMIDTLHRSLASAIAYQQTLTHFGHDLPPSTPYALCTLHRASNVDHADVLRELLTVFADISERIPMIFPIHPRTRNKIEQFGLMPLIARSSMLLLPPMGYLEMLGLMRAAKLVMTDSGGIQEETTALGVPCLTLRHNTERPITIDEGTNLLVGHDAQLIKTTCADILRNGGKAGRVPALWDGQAAQRIAALIAHWL